MRTKMRLIRGLALGVMLGAYTFGVPEEGHARSVTCQDYCPSACVMTGGGGYFSWQNCSECTGQGCSISGVGCDDYFCIYCEGTGWTCQ